MGFVDVISSWEYEVSIPLKDPMPERGSKPQDASEPVGRRDKRWKDIIFLCFYENIEVSERYVYICAYHMTIISPYELFLTFFF